MKLEEYVREVVSKNKLKNQFEIVAKLKEMYNINIVQSNLSKILKRVGAVKTVENNESYYIIKDKKLAVEGWVVNLVVEVVNNSQNIVIKTYNGAANIISQIIDEKELDNIMATLAGDNVVLVIPKDVSIISETEALIRKILMSK